MLSSYKRLGDYIRLVDERNRNLEVETLLGLSMTKQFRKSTSNVVGTDMSKYKIVRKDRFACDFMSVIRVFKLPVVLQTSDDPILVSPAYAVFEVIDENILLPEYLMMWFRRDEFDRYCFFKCDSAVRGGFNWEELCDTQLPVPSIEKQKEIIAEYEAVEQRIRLNNTLCEKLEETAQTLYRHWFEDFEFPYSRHCEERGTNDEAISLNELPNVAESNAAYQRNNSHSMTAGYKSSGGEMVYSEELGKEIPKGWKVSSLNQLVENSLGGDWGKEFSDGNYSAKVLCIRGADIPNLHYADGTKMPTRFILEKNLKNRRLEEGNIVIEISGGSPTQSTGRSIQLTQNILDHLNENIICSNFCRALSIKKGFSNLFSSKLKYEYERDTFFRYENSSNGVKNLNIGDLFGDLSIVYNEDVVKQFDNLYNTIKSKHFSLGKQNQKLEELKSMLLGKMAVE